jgi:hypothetical protein
VDVATRGGVTGPDRRHRCPARSVLRGVLHGGSWRHRSRVWHDVGRRQRRVALVPFAVLTWAMVRAWRSALGVGGWERSSIALIEPG